MVSHISSKFVFCEIIKSSDLSEYSRKALDQLESQVNGYLGKRKTRIIWTPIQKIDDCVGEIRMIPCVCESGRLRRDITDCLKDVAKDEYDKYILLVLHHLGQTSDDQHMTRAETVMTPEQKKLVCIDIRYWQDKFYKHSVNDKATQMLGDCIEKKYNEICNEQQLSRSDSSRKTYPAQKKRKKRCNELVTCTFFILESLNKQGREAQMQIRKAIEKRVPKSHALFTETTPDQFVEAKKETDVALFPLGSDDLNEDFTNALSILESVKRRNAVIIAMHHIPQQSSDTNMPNIETLMTAEQKGKVDVSVNIRYWEGNFYDHKINNAAKDKLVEFINSCSPSRFVRKHPSRRTHPGATKKRKRPDNEENESDHVRLLAVQESVTPPVCLAEEPSASASRGSTTCKSELSRGDEKLETEEKSETHTASDPVVVTTKQPVFASSEKSAEHPCGDDKLETDEKSETQGASDPADGTAKPLPWSSSEKSREHSCGDDKLETDKKSESQGASYPADGTAKSPAWSSSEKRPGNGEDEIRTEHTRGTVVDRKKIDEKTKNKLSPWYRRLYCAVVDLFSCTRRQPD